MPHTKYDPMFEESKFGLPTPQFQEEEDTSDQPTMIDWNTTFRSQPTSPATSGEDDWFFLSL